MVVRRSLTPETFLTLPRRGDLVPNENGTLGLFSVSTPGLGGETKEEWRVIRLSSGESWTLIKNDNTKTHDVSWLPGTDGKKIACLRRHDGGATELVIADAVPPTIDPKPSIQSVDLFDGVVQHLKLHLLADGSVAFAVVGLAGEDGNLYNEEKAPKSLSSARIYDTARVREWDTYVKPQKYAIFYSKLVRRDNGQWSVASQLHNCVKDTALEAPADMYIPGNPSGNFDISAKGIAFVAHDPNPSKIHYSNASDVFFAPVDSWSEATEHRATCMTTGNEAALGVSANPRFSPDGTMIAYLKTPFANEADTRLIIGQICSLIAVDVFKTVIDSSWELVPSSFEFAPDGESILIVADDHGRRALHQLKLRHHTKPIALVKNRSVSAVYPLTGGSGSLQVLVTASTGIEGSIYAVVDTAQKLEDRIISSTNYGAKFGLRGSQVSEIWFEGANETCVHAWVTYPSNYDEKKKWPVILEIHGGPADSWRDDWHWRWNAALWAEQGYVVVRPNFTGSVGYGVKFASGIYGEWGGRPYQDLVHCMHYLAKIPSLDMDRVVAAGGSYGGYMAAWILGHALAQKFKAIICHDPCFDMRMSFLYSDETGGISDFNGPPYPWANAKSLDKWNPARPELLQRWAQAPPTLVIHSDRDFRCPVTDGLAVFRTLQAHGVPSRLLNFPDENHFVLKPENSLVWHQTVFDWIESWVGKGPTE
ncbi:prolyl oligopeptidase [Lasiosphaeria ovina]|uniref:Dipeptidyl-peptidase V n=1 Tax=Lasiosphaeria ovina TaxID=92902 RepID=A0AAE0NDF3_9PEZI|nr:prolyl oligopeptidase [Lasiosphaeria ovina]